MGVDETTVDETGVDETTVDETGVDETTVDETGVDETVVEETGVDEPGINRHNEVRFKQMKDPFECYFNAMLTGGTERVIELGLSYLTSKGYFLITR